MADSDFNPIDYKNLMDWSAYGAQDDFQQGQIDIDMYDTGDVNTSIGQPPEEPWQDYDDAAFNDWLAGLSQPPALSGSGTINPAALSTTPHNEQPELYTPGDLQPPQSYSQVPTWSPGGNRPANVSSTPFEQSRQDNDQKLAQTLDSRLLSNHAYDQTAVPPIVPPHSTAFHTPRSPRSILNTGLPARPPTTTATPRTPGNVFQTPRSPRSILNTGLPTRPPRTTTTSSSENVFQASDPRRSILDTGLPTRSPSTAVNNSQTQFQNLSLPTPTSNQAYLPGTRISETETPSKQRLKKTHPCTWEGCERTFAGPHNVKQHIREAHTGERPYKCPECYHAGVEKAFARPGSLNRHRKDLHGVPAGPGRGHVKRQEGGERNVRNGVGGDVGNGGGRAGGKGSGARWQHHPGGDPSVLHRAAAPQTPFRSHGRITKAPWCRQEALVDSPTIADASNAPTTAFGPMIMEPGEEDVYDTIETPDFGSPLCPSHDFEQVAKALRRKHVASHNHPLPSVADTSSLPPASSILYEQTTIPIDQNIITSNNTFREHAEQGSSALPVNGFQCFSCYHVEGTQNEILEHMHEKHEEPKNPMCSCGACRHLYPCSGDAGIQHAKLLRQITVTPPAAGGDAAPERYSDPNAVDPGRRVRGGARPSNAFAPQA